MPGRPPSMYGEGFNEKVRAFDRALLWFTVGSVFGASVMTVLIALRYAQA